MSNFPQCSKSWQERPDGQEGPECLRPLRPRNPGSTRDPPPRPAKVTAPPPTRAPVSDPVTRTAAAQKGGGALLFLTTGATEFRPLFPPSACPPPGLSRTWFPPNRTYWDSVVMGGHQVDLFSCILSLELGCRLPGDFWTLTPRSASALEWKLRGFFGGPVGDGSPSRHPVMPHSFGGGPALKSAG